MNKHHPIWKLLALSIVAGAAKALFNDPRPYVQAPPAAPEPNKKLDGERLI